MKVNTGRLMLVLGVAMTAWMVDGGPHQSTAALFVSSAEARFGRPATPVSYAGVARRTTVRAATPGVGAPGVGVAPGVGAGGVGGPASGVGVLPGAGGGRAGIGANAGGPVNRVGVR